MAPRSLKEQKLKLFEQQIQQQEEKLSEQQSQIKEIVELVSGLEATNKTLRLDLNSAGVKFQKLNQAFSKNKEAFGKLKLRSEEITASTEIAIKEHSSLFSKHHSKRLEIAEQAIRVDNLEMQRQAAMKKKGTLESLVDGFQRDK